MEQKELHGGSYHWWPPTKDHKFLYKLNPVRFEHFDRFMDGWDGIRVLDVGCGGGYACELLAQRKAVVFGTDIMAESLLEARNHAKENNLEIEYHQCTAERLPFNDQTMDAVTCFDVLEHIPNKGQTLGEIHRVLKPGGWLFFDTFNKTFWSKIFIIWLGEILIRFMPRGTHEWPLFISPPELMILLENMGFTTVDLAGVKPIRLSKAKGKFPAKISSQGRTAIIYFGAARKPNSAVSRLANSEIKG
jgi:2-polyprenyl-6-hydroxyphenyl methylase / 3-demethylubiquinone-9 3-methyltransferase